MAFNAQIEKKDDYEFVFLSGKINEDAEIGLADLQGKITGNCIFNFKSIESINSCGVRAWIHFLREIEKKGTVAFEECTPEIVSQINMIPSFKGNANIHSVYASYVCNDCDNKLMHLYKAGENLPTDPNAELEPVKCPKCNSTMEMEELPEEFFAWVSP